MKRIFVLATLVAVDSIAPAHAGGFGLEQQNAKAIGAAYAGAQAQSGDAGFAYYNPAAIADTDSFQISFSLAGLFPSARYHDASATLLGAFPVSGRAEGDGVVADAVVPNASIALPLTDALVVGLVVDAPFGLNTRYAADSLIRYHALKTDAKFISITPLISVEAYPGVVVGAGVRFQYLDLEASSAIDAAGVATASGLPGFTPGTSDAHVLFEGNDWAAGFTVGAQAQVNDRLRAGASYASKIDHDLNGVADFDLSGSAAGQIINALTGSFETTTFSSALVTPASASAGVIYRASDRLDLMASAVFTRWSDFEGLTATFANPAQPPDVFTQDWKDVWAFSVGAEYELTQAVRLRAGFMYDDSPVNDAFASPRIPDADRYWINAGLSWDARDKITIDGGFGFLFLEERRVDLSSALPENIFRGDLTSTFDGSGPVLALRLHYRR